MFAFVSTKLCFYMYMAVSRSKCMSQHHILLTCFLLFIIYYFCNAFHKKGLTSQLTYIKGPSHKKTFRNENENHYLKQSYQETANENSLNLKLYYTVVTVTVYCTLASQIEISQ